MGASGELRPLFDREGYPVDEFLDQLEKWRNLEEVMHAVADAWKWPEDFYEALPGLWVAHTLGWSGNESLISALFKNPLFIWCAKYMEVSGGHYVIAITDEAKSKFDELIQGIFDQLPRKEGKTIAVPEQSQVASSPSTS
jgi:hypothetical protein